MSSDLIDLDLLVEEAQSLEPLPASTLRLATVIANEDWNVRDVSEIVRLDQALTGRILGAANSVVSGSRHRITSIDQAIVRMGPGAVLSMAIGDSVKNDMKAAVPQYGLSEGELWRHSIAAALTVENARSFCRVPIGPQAFATALLHDLGKLVLARHLDPTILSFLTRACGDDGRTEEEAEQEILNVGHAEVGAIVARYWKLPESISLGIQYHHVPSAAPDEETRKLCYQLQLADAVATAIGAGCGEASQEGLTPAIADRLGISQSMFDELCERVSERFSQVVAAYG